MGSYTHFFVLLAIIGVLTLAKVAVRFAIEADIFQQIAVECRLNHLRMQGKKADKEEVEKEIIQRAKEMEKGE